MCTEERNEERIFDTAVQLKSRTERDEYLSEVCAGDKKLRASVEELLRHHDADSFLDVPPVDSDVTLDDPPVSESPGTIIDRYKLLERIGEGGMAVVYMAEQQKPIRRKVALKIIKLGMDTKQVIARFEAERQALAMMDHPYIAKVLDAGATETGRPYFVMDLVQGVSITDYCDKNRLSIRERLGLFIDVCSAVQHAHQKGIIHRDIKPSNVMVTGRDGKPVPKIIDFGIAKATNQRLTEKTLFTRYAHIIGTPAYMSPEQAELSELDVDTRTDIYSLGVLLYELLTGATPFSEAELREAGYLQMQKIICEAEPTKPSTKLSTLGEALTDVAKWHSSSPEVMRRLIRGDLDWIVMKTLEKDRGRRYDTASALGADVQRHLNNEPIHARAPRAMYRFQKFARRHRSTTIAAVVIAVLTVSMTCIFSLWYRNRLQLVKAESATDKGILSQAHESFSEGDLAAALKSVKLILNSKHFGPDARLLYAGILVEGKQSDDAVNELKDLLDERPEIAGAAYTLLARILWEDDSRDTENLKQIDAYRQKAEELLPETAEAYFLRAMTALTIKERLELLDNALSIDNRHYESYRLRAFTYYASRKYKQMKDDALAMCVLRPNDPMCYYLRASSLRELGDCEGAIENYDKAIGLPSVGSSQPIELHAQLSEIYLHMGEYEQAIKCAEEGMTLSQDGTILEFRIFCALVAAGDYEEASSLYHRVTDSDLESKRKLRHWSMKYVFDTLDAGDSWHPIDSKPHGPAFLSMIEAEETYHSLSTRAKRLIAGGFNADSSPDGTKMAFTLGFPRYSGVAVFDLATQEINLLMAPGKDPKWSPDGQHIAFVRENKILDLSELTTVGSRTQTPYYMEQIWVMKADGTEPRRLANGHWPSWSQDSKHVYYQSRYNSNIYSASIGDKDVKRRPILACPQRYPSVSPDDKYAAYVESQSLRIVDIDSQSPVANWAGPLRIWGGNWAPKSHEFSLGGDDSPEDITGLWIYDMHKKRGRKSPQRPDYSSFLEQRWDGNVHFLGFSIL